MGHLAKSGRSIRLRPLGVIAGVALTLGGTRVVSGQDAVDDVFRVPLLTTSATGHTAPIRSLVFAPGSLRGNAAAPRLLSGGEDKVIHAWDYLGGRPSPSQTLRPPIGRGRHGSVYAMALSPRPDSRGERLLAVAGHGMAAGEILLFRYPGFGQAPTGQVVARLPSPDHLGDAHTSTVNHLAIAPMDGRWLASGGADGQVRIWDLQTFRCTRVLPQGAAVTGLGFAVESGRVYLVTAGANGRVRSWDLSAAANRGGVEAPIQQVNAGVPIQALAVDPFGRWVVAARSGTTLPAKPGEPAGVALFALGTPRTLGRVAPVPLPLPVPRADQGGYEVVAAMAVSPDGSRVTSALIRRLPRAGEESLPPLVTDLVEHQLPGGRLVGTTAVAADRILACAYSPDGQWLAYAGGRDQSIVVRQRVPDGRTALTRVFQGPGQGLTDAGFFDPQVLAFPRLDPATRQTLPGAYWAFHLGEGRLDPAPEPTPAIRRRVAASPDGSLRIEASDLRQLVLVNGDRRIPLGLHPVIDHPRWWSSTLIPPGPGHDAWTIAVGCSAGVALFDVEGKRLRTLGGHSAPVTVVVPSPDGRWLLTGSLDQTFKLFPLAGCDRPSELGASFEVRDGSLVVAAVVPGSFAESADLRPGDVVEEAFVGADSFTRNDRVAMARLLEESLQGPKRIEGLAFGIRREGTRLARRRNTELTDAPTLGFFPTVRGEWVLWMPKTGFYDASIAGDVALLGWHQNRGEVEAGPAALARWEPTTFSRLSDLRPQLYRPEVVRGVLRAAEAPVPEPPPAVEPAPRVEIVQPAIQPGVVLAAANRTERLAVRVAPHADGRRIRSVDVRVNGLSMPGYPRAVDWRKASHVLEVDVPLSPGVNEVVVSAANGDGLSTEDRRLLESPLFREDRPPKALIAAIAHGAFPGERPSLAEILFAAEDAALFRKVFGGQTSENRLAAEVVAGPTLEEVAPEAIDRFFQEIRERHRRGALGPGDLLLLFVESHLLGQPGSEEPLELALTVEGRPARLVADRLAAELVDLRTTYRMSVQLFVDVWHQGGPTLDTERFREWIHELCYRGGVVVHVASSTAPGFRTSTGERLGAFARGLREAFTRTERLRVLKDRLRPGEPYRFGEFREVLQSVVDRDTSRRGQYVELYLPTTLSDLSPLFPIGTRPQQLAQTPR